MELISLLPLVQPLLNKLSEGRQLRASEANLVLLYSMAESNRDMKDQMKGLAEDFKRFNNTQGAIAELINALRSDVAYVKGKIDS